MKVLCIGDIHGLTSWRRVIEQNEFDKVVFIGDYFDNFENTTGQEQLDNFREILNFKKYNPDKVRLLLGNHDYQYLPGVKDRYSGFQPVYSLEYGHIIQKAIDENLLKCCWYKDGVMYSHAGISKTWLRSTGYDDRLTEPEKIQNHINELLVYKPKYFKFTPGINYNNSGNDITQGPLWIRGEGLREDAIAINQVFGHTQIKSILPLSSKPIQVNIDALPYGEYLIVENNTFTVKKIRE